MTSANAPPSNRLLDSLPKAHVAALMARMETVPLVVGETVCLAGGMPRYAHFVITGMVSVVEQMENGDVIEVGMVGCEGLVEALHLLGDTPAPSTAFVQVQGSALRISFADLRKEFMEDAPLRKVILGYVQTGGYIAAQLAACNRLHEVEPRMSRWLLMVQDRVDAGTFLLTQEFLAEMIGARRTTITLAARRMQAAGLIRYARGRVHVLDRKALEQSACECYAIIAKLTDGNARPARSLSRPNGMVFRGNG